MKVKALIECVGLGYDLKKDETAELKPELGKKLIQFGYVEAIEPQSGSDNDKKDPSFTEENTINDKSVLTVDDLPHKSGWYELPNGEKVQGKEKAEEALAELNKEKSEE